MGTKVNRNKYIGKQFNRLIIIIEELEKRKIKCICTCGKEKIMDIHNVISNRSKSCGCLNIEKNKLYRKPVGYNSLTGLINNYKNSAKRKNHIFELTREEFSSIINQNCFYCNKPPSNIIGPTGGKCSKEWKQLGKIFYSGIDRMDNTIGYIKSNCLSCCSICNYIKSDYSLDFLKEHLEKMLKAIRNI